MPEGDVIKKLANKWGKLEGETFELLSPQGKFEAGAKALTGSKLLAVDAHGKHLFLQFAQDSWLHVHLGLYGRFRFHDDVPEPKGAVRLRAIHDNKAIDLNGPTKCEVITNEEKKQVHERLGPDPLREDASIDSIKEWLTTSKWTVGKTLMAQERIAGLGNIYRAEILFMLQINPYSLNKDLSEQAWDDIWKLSKILLEASVKRGGMIMTTGADSPRALSVKGKRPSDDRCYVYKRTGKPCYGCGNDIEQALFEGRTVYWCNVCQPLITTDEK